MTNSPRTISAAGMIRSRRSMTSKRDSRNTTPAPMMITAMPQCRGLAIKDNTPAKINTTGHQTLNTSPESMTSAFPKSRMTPAARTTPPKNSRPQFMRRTLGRQYSTSMPPMAELHWAMAAWCCISLARLPDTFNLPVMKAV